jgi:hypothetical protein
MRPGSLFTLPNLDLLSSIEFKFSHTSVKIVGDFYYQDPLLGFVIYNSDSFSYIVSCSGILVEPRHL